MTLPQVEVRRAVREEIRSEGYDAGNLDLEGKD